MDCCVLADTNACTLNSTNPRFLQCVIQSLLKLQTSLHSQHFFFLVKNAHSKPQHWLQRLCLGPLWMRHSVLQVFMPWLDLGGCVRSGSLTKHTNYAICEFCELWLFWGNNRIFRYDLKTNLWQTDVTHSCFRTQLCRTQIMSSRFPNKFIPLRCIPSQWRWHGDMEARLQSQANEQLSKPFSTNI